jgi:hypothetical protein
MREEMVAVLFKWLLGVYREIDLDEAELLKLSERHRVDSLLYPRIKEISNFSSTFKYAVKTAYLNNFHRVSVAQNFLHELDDFFQNAGITGLVLKGILLSENYYDDRVSRHARDLDLLVDLRHVEIVRYWLLGKGFFSDTNFTKYNKKQQEQFFRLNHHLVFYGSDPVHPRVVELHWKLRSDDDAFGMDPFNNKSELLSTRYKCLFALNHLDQFIYLCVHGSEHAWYRLKWLMDLPMILMHKQFGWKKMEQRASELNAVEHLQLALYVLYKISDQLFVDGYEPMKMSRKIKRKSAYVLLKLTKDDFIELGYKTAFENLLFIAGFNKRMLSLRFWSSRWITSADWLRFPLPEKFFFLYYPMRPFFWLIRRCSNN